MLRINKSELLFLQRYVERSSRVRVEALAKERYRKELKLSSVCKLLLNHHLGHKVWVTYSISQAMPRVLCTSTTCLSLSACKPATTTLSTSPTNGLLSLSCQHGADLRKSSKTLEEGFHVSKLISVQWKTFNFFDISQVKSPDDGDKASIFEVCRAL